ncbi:MAG: GYD domain-containing protein [Acidimicrobiia bacterium]
MPKYLAYARYTPEGVRGLLQEGGTSRASSISRTVENLGGNLEGFYFMFGTDDAVALIELPTNVDAAALSLAIGATGLIGIRTVPLLTPEELDQATRTVVDYRPPGA